MFLLTNELECCNLLSILHSVDNGTPSDCSDSLKSLRRSRSPAAVCQSDESLQVSQGAQMWLSLQTPTKRNTASLSQKSIDLSLTRLLDNTTTDITNTTPGRHVSYQNKTVTLLHQIEIIYSSTSLIGNKIVQINEQFS